MAAVGVPESVAVPLAPAEKVTPVGNVPVRVIVGAGDPVVVIENENGSARGGVERSSAGELWSLRHRDHELLRRAQALR